MNCRSARCEDKRGTKKKPNSCASPCATRYTRSSVQGILDAMLAGNLAPIAAILAPDVTLRLNTFPPVVGREAVLAFLTGGTPLSITLQTFLLGVAANGASFITLSALVQVAPGVFAPEIAILTLNAQCLVTSIEEVLAFPPGT